MCIFREIFLQVYSQVFPVNCSLFTGVFLSVSKEFHSFFFTGYLT